MLRLSLNWRAWAFAGSLLPRGRGRIVLALAALIATFVVPARHAGASGQCANPIACENLLTGTPESVWDISGSGDPGLQGFATDTGVNAGATVSFKISSTFSSYAIDIYRLGYYGGDGARKVASIAPSIPNSQNQPACATDVTTGLVDCGNWKTSASWAVPATAVSGVYLARLSTTSGAASHVVFVVRNDASSSAVLFRTNDTTWQAYNQYGGNSLYQGSAPSSDGRAYKVSFNRPYSTRGQGIGYGASNWLFYAEFPMIRWLESNGYDVSYMSEIDAERSPSLLLNHRVLMTAGHDEYWSAGQRSAVQAARDAGVNLALFTGNDMFWKVRWESSIDGSATPYRTMVSYKETKAGKPIDPQDPTTWTGTWRDTTASPPADGGKPENALLGQIFEVNRGSGDLTLTSQFSKLRLWRNTHVAGLTGSQTIDMGAETIGYEWDVDLDNGFRPAGTFDLSATTISAPEVAQDFGNTYAPGTVTHSLTMYRAASGALVFDAGTVQWAWGLDTDHDTGPDSGPDTTSVDMQQATVNLLADMRAQPTTLQQGLVTGSASTDSTPPTSHVTSPAPGAMVTSGAAVTVSGTASDTGGGVVAGVEVSTDAGTTWHKATGAASWTYSWTPGVAGATTIRSRAVDDSGNLESPSASVGVTVSPRACPCTLFPANAVPANPSANDGQAIEVGTKFQVDGNSYVTGVRFYKGSANTGTHVGNLWTSTGTLLATGTFSGESASGWQTLTFSSPVPVTPNATYMVSYHTTSGFYAADAGFFMNAYNAWPVHAPAANLASGGNGVYAYGGTQFPGSTFDQTSYWVDPIVSTVNTTAPAAVTATPAPNATGVSYATTLTVGFNKNVTASSISFALARSGGGSVAGSTTYNATTYVATFAPGAPLALGTSYTATVSGATDSNGSVMSPFSWSFTTMSCPCTLFLASATPTLASDADTSPTELGVKFRSDLSGYVNGVRFYKGSGNTGSHIGSLWTSDGQLLASATFSGETASGWQQVLFATPVAIAAGTTYVASYHTSTGHYSYDGSYFNSSTDRPPLHAPSTGTIAGGNGVYAYSAGRAFPNQTYAGANYWVDALFNTSFSDTVAPAVASTSPAAGAANTLPTSVTATFNKSVVQSSIQFKLTGAGSAQVAGTVSYDDATLTATFTPGATLAQGTTYTATVSGATDHAGNVMASPATWSFSTVTCPCSLFPSTATPSTVTSGDASAVELGMRFTSDIGGLVTGVRFYKGPSNTGTHTGSLWTTGGGSGGGQLLATVTFTGETASGWQQALFSSPVAITAGTTYVISYHTTAGQYSLNGGYFGSDVYAAPLHGVANGVSPNGVYAYGPGGTVPTQSYNASNYWVDVVFNTTAP